LGVVALIYVRYTRNQPSDVGLPDFRESEQHPVPANMTQAAELKGVIDVRVILTNPAVWITGVMYFFVKLTRYSFLFWLPYYMTHALAYSERRAGYTSSVYEFVGFFGVIVAGYLSDKVFQSRRFPVGSLMLFGLAGACLVEPTLAAFGFWGTVLGIALIGMMTYGPDSLMSGAAAMDMGTPRGAATAAGVINGMGSAGQLVSSYLVVYVSETWGWNSLFYLFVVFALVGAILLATKWDYGGRGTAVGIAQPEAMKGGVSSI
jgi:OPA family glycerol-3-phosphate transporter-like MFS transporter